MKKVLSFVILIFALTILLVGCGTPPATPSTPTAVPPTEAKAAATAITETADPCSPGQIEAEVQNVHKHMREFDDASILASNMPREQLSGSIADLQRIRREAEDEAIPACLTTLKTYQVQHMNSVISTLISFMGGTDKKSLDQGIALARQQHDQYTLELARVLGLTVVPAEQAGTLPAETPSVTTTP